MSKIKNVKTINEEKQATDVSNNDDAHMMNKNSLSVRSVAQIIKSLPTSDGEGVQLNRSFPNNTISEFDPFLLLDEIGPIEIPRGTTKGFPEHPHRGFETVTYMLEGFFEHRDSQGHSGIIGTGDVQWMTAGSGVIHSEMPEKKFSKTGGKLHGFQLWVNLPKSNKMMKPRYQEIPKHNIPKVTSKDGNITVKVIAGESLGKKAVINTVIPIIYLHLKLEPGSSLLQPVPKEYNVFAYIFGGNAKFKQSVADNKIDDKIGKSTLVLFDRNGEGIYIKALENSKDPLELLLIGGIPLNEPIARYGPFVMNTKEEIYQAMEDYRNGIFGQLY